MVEMAVMRGDDSMGWRLEFGGIGGIVD